MLPGSVLAHAQARKMLESVATHTPLGYRNRVMLELLYTSGIRAGELLGLDVGHVDFPNGTARVTGKGEKERIVGPREPRHPPALRPFGGLRAGKLTIHDLKKEHQRCHPRERDAVDREQGGRLP